MASWVGVIVFLAAIILSIVLGEVLKINQGLLAFACAFIIGTGISGIAPANVIAKCFPVSVLFLLMITTFFYGFMNNNGLIKNLADRMVWAFRKRPALIPVVTVFAAMIMSALGASGEGTVLVLSPLFFSLAINMGFDPILAVIAAGCGGVSASYLYWVGSGAFQIGMLEPFVGYDVAFASMETCAIIAMITTLILFAIYYFVTKGFKVKAPENLQKPEPLNKKQKLSLWYILIAIFCLVIVPLLAIIFPGPFFGKLSNFLNIRVVMTLGVIACILTKVGDERQVVSKNIPWNLIIMLCGMMTLISLASQVGTIDFVTSLFNEGLNPTLAIVIVFVFTAALGAVTGGLTVIMLLAAIAPAIAAASGVPLVIIMAAGLCGTDSMFISPYSTGGAMALSGCPDELRSSVMKKQYLLMFVHAAIMFILVILGLSGALATSILG